MRDYTKIDAWKLADDLTVGIYEITRGFPKEELYSLIRAVEKEAGVLSKVVATITSLLVICLSRGVGSPVVL